MAMKKTTPHSRNIKNVKTDAAAKNKIAKNAKYSDLNNNVDKSQRTSSDWSFIASLLKSWSRRSDALVIEEFYTDQNIPRAVYYDAVERNEEMKEAHEFAKTRIGINLEKLGFQRNPSMIKDAMTDYMDRRRKGEEWKATLRAMVAQAQAPTTINYITAKVPKDDDDAKD